MWEAVRLGEISSSWLGRKTLNLETPVRARISSQDVLIELLVNITIQLHAEPVLQELSSILCLFRMILYKNSILIGRNHSLPIIGR